MIWYILSASVAIGGFFFNDPLLINVSLILILLVFITNKLSEKNVINLINPILFLAISKIISSIGNIFGYIYQSDPILKWKYWYYAIPENLFEAALIHFFSSIAIIAGYEFFKDTKVIKSLTLNFQINIESLRQYDFWILLYITIVQLDPSSPLNLGFLSTLIVSLFVFIYSYQSEKSIGHKNYYTIRAIFLLLLLTYNALDHSYLRYDIISPSILFLIGKLWGRGNVKVFFSYSSIPIVIFLSIFIISFSDLGINRTQSVYTTREVMEYNLANAINGDKIAELNKLRDFATLEEQDKPIIGRLSNFNQLTKLVELQKKEGFFWGEASSYFFIALVPRVLWPGKPQIAAGKWFAVKADLAYTYEDGTVNNSVDMGIGGELYLNFGYIIMIIGCFFIGGFWVYAWNLCNFFDGLNITGIMLGSYILVCGYGQFGADLQQMITVITTYMAIKFFDVVLNNVFKASS